MSTQPKVELGRYNLKEISLILLISMVVVVTVIVAIGLAIAITNDTSDIKFTGTFDLGQYQAIVIGIAFVATVLVAQQLTSKNQAQAIKDNDATWLAEELAKIEAPSRSLTLDKPIVFDNPIAEIPEIDEEDDLLTLHEEMPAEVPPAKETN